LNETSEAQPAISIFAKLPGDYSYAAWQNSIPLLRSLTISNTSGDIFDDVEIELTSEPPFLRSKTWKLSRLLARDKVTLEDRDIDLDVRYLGGLNEAERGQLRFKVTAGEKQLAESVIDA